MLYFTMHLGNEETKYHLCGLSFIIICIINIRKVNFHMHLNYCCWQHQPIHRIAHTTVIISALAGTMSLQ